MKISGRRPNRVADAAERGRGRGLLGSRAQIGAICLEDDLRMLAYLLRTHRDRARHLMPKVIDLCLDLRHRSLLPNHVENRDGNRGARYYGGR